MAFIPHNLSFVSAEQVTDSSGSENFSAKKGRIEDLAMGSLRGGSVAKR